MTKPVKPVDFDWSIGLKITQKTHWLMSLQELTGIGFDIAKAISLGLRILDDQAHIEKTILPLLPGRPLKRSERGNYKLPAKPFKKDGSFSELFLRFLKKHQGEVLPGNQEAKFFGKIYKIESNQQIELDLPMDLSNQSDLKQWFLLLGWQPLYWNTVKDENGKPKRDPETGKIIRTTPKIQENGRICPNLELLKGDLVKPVLTWLSLRNRYAVLNGWIHHDRLLIDNRLPAGSSGLANTGRQKHTCVVNVPKAEAGVTLGREFRSLFIARPGAVLVGYDAAALETRVEAHYTWKFDNGEYARELLEGDVHSKNARLFYERELLDLGIDLESVTKDDPRFKPFRSKSKNAKYALTYGCSAQRLGSTLGVSEDRSRILYEEFWTVNVALAKLKKTVEQFWESTGEKIWIRGIDKRKIFTRSKSSLINALFQSAGACVMDLSGCYMDKVLGGIKLDQDKLPVYNYQGFEIRRVGYFHDEYIFECPPDIAEEVGKLGVESIEKAGRYFDFKVPLTGEYKIGGDWSQIH